MNEWMRGYSDTRLNLKVNYLNSWIVWYVFDGRDVFWKCIQTINLQMQPSYRISDQNHLWKRAVVQLSIEPQINGKSLVPRAPGSAGQWSPGKWEPPYITGLELNFQVAEGQPEGAHKATSPVIASPGPGLPRHQSGWELTRVSPEQKKTSSWGRETYLGRRAGDKELGLPPTSYVALGKLFNIWSRRPWFHGVQMINTDLFYLWKFKSPMPGLWQPGRYPSTWPCCCEKLHVQKPQMMIGEQIRKKKSLLHPLFKNYCSQLLTSGTPQQ